MLFKELQNCERKLFLCPPQKCNPKKSITNILNCYFSKKLYPMTHETKYLHVES